MRSRAARLTLCVLSWIALATAAAFLIQSERRINERRAVLRTFDQHARDSVRLLGELRAAQQAYVAVGQGVDFWMPRVNGMTAEAAALVDTLRGQAAGAPARGSLMEAAATLTEFGNVDRRAREYLKSDLQLMAGDVVFTEGGQTAGQAADQIESARIAEHQDLDAWEGAERRQQAMLIAASAGFAALGLGFLAFVPARPHRDPQAHVRALEPESAADELPRATVPVLKVAAELCTELGRVNDLADLNALLARAASLMDASGLIVWLGNTAGADLRPVLAHGYGAQALARMPAVTRTANNAAAAAYRTGALQIVLTRPGQSNGALVAPLLTPEGCVGALTAEIQGGGETSDATQSLAAIFAAQLASVLASSAVPAAEPADNRIASA